MRYFFLLSFLFSLISTEAQFDVASRSLAMQYAAKEVATMSMDEKIGQLFMIRAHSNLGDSHVKEIERQIKKFHVGGLCFFQGTPQKQAELTQKYQKLSKRPLMIAMDAEWGLGMRFKKEYALSFPKNMTLGAIQDNNAIFKMGECIAEHLKRIGVNVNFAPVVDVNNNPANPVIHNRSFGEDIYNVATKSYALMRGLQDNDVLACAKHFPGHGDTNLDSHYDLPIISHDRTRLNNVELMPFRVLSQLGVGSMMTAHLQVPALDDRKNRPTSLSDLAIKKTLITELNFEGLIFTDALEMKGVAKHFSVGDMEVEALNAGNDVLLLPLDIDKAFTAIKNALLEGLLDSAEIDKKVAKVLQHKFLLGLNKKPIIKDISTISKDLLDPNAFALKTKLYEKAITLVKDDKNSLPIKDAHKKKIATVAIGNKSLTRFQLRVSDFSNARHFNINKTFTTKEKQLLLKDLASYDIVLINIHDMNIYASKDYGLNSELFNLLFSIESQNKTIVTVHGTPYSLKFLYMLPTVIVAYEDDVLMQDVAAQSIFGVTGFQGRLPVSINPHFKIKTGIEKPSLMTLGYAIPERVGINSDTLLKIDTIVEEMISNEAAPGCQIVAIKNGRMIFEKSYGYHTYDKKEKVKNSNIYDVASITKILCTTLGVMKLVEDNVIDIHNPVRSYLPHIDTSNKADLIIEDLLAHHAGLPAWIPFYRNTVEEKNKKSITLDKYYRSTYSDSFNIEVAKNLYLRFDYRDSIYQKIYACGLREKRDYRYSDLAFYLFKDIIEDKSGLSLDKYVAQNFYDPLGLQNTVFNPHQLANKYSIIPSEKDQYFRNQVIKGYVHDMGAAMLGGVAGHAGLFSNARELGILLQMLINGGSYNGKQLLKPETIQKFTTRYHRSTRRGLGFDMKELNEDKMLNMSELASKSTFGHLGFTGISVFADPENDFIFVFLSNRTFPTMENRKFGRENYRPRIQSVFYNAMNTEN